MILIPAEKNREFVPTLKTWLESDIEEKDRYLFPEIWPDAVRMRGRPKKDEAEISEPEPEKVEID